MKKVVTVLTFFFLILAFTSLGINASDFGPGRRGHDGGTQPVAEPATIALLGAGLVTLGLYVRKKHNKNK